MQCLPVLQGGIKLPRIDQMISPTPGQYACVTVFDDHKSNLSYVHLQRSTSAKETMEAKEAFERYAQQREVKVKHYHAENGAFAAHDWVRHMAGQGLMFAAVGMRNAFDLDGHEIGYTFVVTMVIAGAHSETNGHNILSTVQMVTSWLRSSSMIMLCCDQRGGVQSWSNTIVNRNRIIIYRILDLSRV
jgi:hypothetical protein